MANNRLWAVCKADNECACLGKSYGDWSGLRSPDDFFKKHLECEGQAGGGENITFVTENEDGKDGRVILFDFQDLKDIRIYLRGDEEKPKYKEWITSRQK